MSKLAYFLLVAFSILVILFAGKPVHATYEYNYGGGGGKTILVDKLVGKVETTTKGGDPVITFVDNLSPSDPRFSPGQGILFKIRVKNTSNEPLIGVKVKDFVPSFLDPIEGPGTFDVNSRIITFEAGDFDPDVERTFTIKMKVLSQDQLPSDKGLFCLVNKAEASNEEAFDEDTAQFCIEKQVQGVTIPTSVPSAGPELGVLLLSAELAFLAIGLGLKKKTS